MTKRILPFLLLVLAAFAGHAQSINITALGVASSQNFNSLTTSTVSWTDNSTLPAWYAARTVTAITQAVADNGSSTGNLFNYGLTGQADRALGAVPTAAGGPTAWGVLIGNNTGAVLQGIRVSFTGEQYRKAVGVITPQTLECSYKVSPTALSSPEPASAGGTNSWVVASGLQFVSPVYAAGAFQTLDGNQAANRQVFTNVLVPVNVPAGQYVFLRWRHIQPSTAPANAQGLSIDDFSVEGANIPFRSFASLPTGALDQLSTWRDGSNVAPTSFTDAYQTFTLTRNAALSTALTIGGNLSKLVVGAAGNAAELTLAAASALAGPVDVAAQGSLVVQGAAVPTFGTLAGPVRYEQAAGFTIPQVPYQNLTLAGAGLKTFATGAYTVAGSLASSAPMGFGAAGATSLSLAGNLTLAAGASYADTSAVPTLTTSGNGVQTLSGAIPVRVFNLASTKSSGRLALSGARLVVNGTTTLIFNSPALFTDGGQDILAQGSFNADGNAAGYALTGQLRFYPVSGAMNVRNSLSGGAIVAALPAVVATPVGANSVNFLPSGSPFASLTMRAFTLAGGPAVSTGQIRFYNNTVNITQGIFRNQRTTDVFTEAASTVVLQGAGTNTLTSASGTETFANLTAGTCTYTGNLALSGNLQATSLAVSGALSFASASAQTLAGTLRAGSLSNQNTSGAGLALAAGASVRVTGAMNLAAASTLNTSAGSLTLASTGYLGTNGAGATVIGSVTSEALLPTPAGSGNWHFVGAQTAGQTVQSAFFTRNVLNASSFVEFADVSSIWRYDATYTARQDRLGWRKFAAASDAVGLGQGVRVWFNKASFFSGAQAGLMSHTGAPRLATLNVPLAYCASGCAYGPGQGGLGTNGWSLAANPFLSGVSWTALVNGGVAQAYRVWNPALNGYGSYAPAVGGTLGATNTIAKGQAVFVQALSAGQQISFTDAARVNSTAGTMLRQGATEQLPYLRLVAHQGSLYEDALLGFSPAAATGFDVREDAEKAAREDLSLAFVEGADRMAISVRPAEAGVLPLELSSAAYPLTLEVSELYDGGQPLPEVALRVQGRLVAFGLGQAVTLRSAQEAAGLALVLGPQAVTAAKPLVIGLSLSPNPASGLLSVSAGSAIRAVRILDLSGKALLHHQAGGGLQIQLSVSALPAGLYTVQVQTAGSMQSQRLSVVR